jgi:probable F420-dependent oxidoreductase
VDLRFGVTVLPSAAEGDDPVAQARHAEGLGFDVVSVWDHLHGPRPVLETWTLLTWIAASTSRISLFSDVLGLPYRNPALTAKMAESLDRLSGGRLLLGLGAGGNDEEFRAFGVPVRGRAEKVAALEEALHIVRRLWTEPTTNFEGTYYRAMDARIEPKPSRPIPIFVGGYGFRTLAITGRLADGWIPSMSYSPPGDVVEKMRLVRQHAQRAGRDPDELTYAYNVPVRVGGDPGPDPDKLVAGEPDDVAERLAGFVRLGFSLLNVAVSGDRTEQRERLARDVIPRVRELVG